MAEKGYATFGSFSNLAKINPEVVSLWARVLKRVPNSRLVIKYKGLGDRAVSRRYLDLFAACGVEPERLDLLPPTSFAEYLEGYGRIDVALDPFPFCGGTTTCESLWMGVPVISCPGETFASRHALSYLSNIGLTETIAGDQEEYVQLAASLTAYPQRLAAIRSGLRDRMAGSSLCDGKQLATDLMVRLRGVWRRWTANRSRDGSHFLQSGS